METIDQILAFVARPEGMIIASCFVVGRIAKGIPSRYIADWQIPLVVYGAGVIQGGYFIHGGRGIVMGLIYAAIAHSGHATILQILSRNEPAEVESREKELIETQNKTLPK